ncbi:MAG: hypothetical protein ACJ8M4_01095 [Chthoniobacterales bacterium]
MRRNFKEWVAAGLILGFAPLHGAHAGDRPAVAKTSSSAALRRDGQAGQAFAVTRSTGATTGQYSFPSVSPLASKAAMVRSESEIGNQRVSQSTVSRRAIEAGPATTPSERKTLTFFRLNSKFGDVLVQPVFGGVNGAQLSLGF